MKKILVTLANILKKYNVKHPQVDKTSKNLFFSQKT